MPARDEKWLQQRYRHWYAVLEIPRSVRPAFKGKRRLVRSLETDSLTIAQDRRHAVLADFKRQIEDARSSQPETSAVRSAIEWRTHSMRQEHPDDQIIAQADIEGSAADIPDPDRRNAFMAIASGQATPFESFLDTWLGEQDIEARSKGDHRRALKELSAWTTAQSIPPTIESFDRRTAGRYVSHLLGTGLDRSKTVSKRLWSLSRFWAWLASKGHTHDNPWRGHEIGRQGRSARDKQPERAFTDAEMARLLSGKPNDPALPDLMRLGLATGATIEELALVRIEDVDASPVTPNAGRTIAFRVDPKTPARRRLVPISDWAWPLVAARLKGKGAGAFLFHELGPAPKEGRQRSMAVSKAFGRYRKTVDVNDEADGQRRGLVNYHSFRRTFVTKAEQAGQPESTIRSVVGHKRQGMTFGVYSGGPSLEQRRQCVESVKIPVDFP